MSDSTRWGRSKWSGSEYAFSEEGGISHTLRTRVGINSRVWADRLSTTHHLKTSVVLQSAVYNLGYGPAPIHPLRTTVTIAATVGVAPLHFTHPLVTSVHIVGGADPAPLRFGHTLHTSVHIDSTAFARLGIPHFLETRLGIAAEAWADALRIGHQLRTAVRIQAEAWAVGITELHLPTIVELLSPLDPTLYTVGILNMLPYPVATDTLEGWAAYGGATVQLDPDHAWFGDHSARLVVPEIGGAGLAIQAAQGMQLLPYGGSILWSGAKLATSTPGTLVQVWTRARYTDGTEVDGDPAEVELALDGLTAEAWELVQAPFLSLDDGKLLSTAWILVEPVEPAGTSTTVYVGAAQMEYDLMMYGPAEAIAIEAVA